MGKVDPVAAWRQADMHARLAEEELRSAWNAYFDGKGPIPTKAQQEEVARRRAAANAKLAAALQRG